MKTIFLILGSNIGDRLYYLENSLVQISRYIGDIKSKSHVYTTVPWGFKAESDFLNMAIKVETLLSATEVLQQCLSIEKFMGRKDRTSPQYKSRTIDIDILFYEDEIINTDTLTVPHPKLQERNFVLVPLSDIYPQGIHPVLHKTILELYDECKDTQTVSKYKSMLEQH